MADQALQKYTGFELDDADALDEEMSKSVSGDWMKLKVGKNRVRFLPGLPGEKPLKLVWEHQLNFEDGKFINFACPRMMAKKPCGTCRKADHLKTTGNPADLDRAKEMFAKRRIYANIIDRSDTESGPKTFAFGKKIWEQLKLIRDDEDFGGDFTHPVTGFDVVIQRKGTTKNNTEYLCKATRQSQLGNDEWLEQVQSLKGHAQILTPEQIKEKLGMDDSDRGKGAAKPDSSSTVVDATFEEVVDDEDLPF